jgi:hypothetical protein
MIINCIRITSFISISSASALAPIDMSPPPGASDAEGTPVAPPQHGRRGASPFFYIETAVLCDGNFRLARTSSCVRLS